MIYFLFGLTAAQNLTSANELTVGNMDMWYWAEADPSLPGDNVRLMVKLHWREFTGP